MTDRYVCGQRKIPEQMPVRPLRSKRALVVDDDSSVARVINQLLESEHHSVTLRPSVGSGIAAIKMGLIPDLAVIDVLFPNASGREYPGGVDVYRALRERSHNTPVVFMTGAYDEERFADVDDAITTNCAVLVQKPLIQLGLHRAIRNAYAKAGK